MGKRVQRPRYTREAVLKAIQDSGGIVSAVAKRLGCDWNTARRYIDRWKETRAAFQAERERVLDLAETTLIKAIKEGDVGAAKWYLSRIGRGRGYGDAVEVHGELKTTMPVIREVVISLPDSPPSLPGPRDEEGKEE